MTEPTKDTQPPSGTPTSKAGSFSVGEWFTILGIVAVAVAAFVRLESRVNQLEPDKLKTAQEAALKEIKDASPATLEVPIGTVIASILRPAKFKELYGDKWILADGSNIIGTPLSSMIQKDSIPDFGGTFLRGINTKDDMVTQDPDGKREPGTLQLDSIREHSHLYNDIFFSEAGGTVPTGLGNKGNTDGDNSGHEIKRTTLASPKPVAETRPKNTAVFFYIKTK